MAAEETEKTARKAAATGPRLRPALLSDGIKRYWLGQSSSRQNGQVLPASAKIVVTGTLAMTTLQGELVRLTM